MSSPQRNSGGSSGLQYGTTLEDAGRLRKEWFREAKRKLKAQDTLIEAAQRRVDRVLKRVRGYPNLGDLDAMHLYAMDQSRELQDFANWLEQYPDWY